MSRRCVPVFLVLPLLAVLHGAASGQTEERPFLGSDVDQDELLRLISTRAPREIRQVGTSSVTMRLELGARDAAFKPRTQGHPRGYLAEVAAYRLARHLGLDNVPPAVVVRIPRRFFQNALDEETAEEWSEIRREIRWDAPGLVRGAAIYWIPDMARTDLDEPAGIERFTGWLRVGGAIPEGKTDLARDLSNMLAFDYLIGNWDRFSGGNVSMTEGGDRVFVRDHNVAFQVPLRGARHERLVASLQRTQRFSRGFVERLLALDEAALRAALAGDREAANRAILNDAQVADVLRRRRTLDTYISALVAVYGVSEVFPFE